MIRGGDAYNTVASWAEAELDLRFVSLDQYKHLTAEIEAIVAAEDVKGTTGTVTRIAFFPPLEAKHSESLLKLYQRAAARIGLTVEGEFTGGCADSGFTAALGVPTLCGLGPVGGYPHTDQEFCRLDTLLPRTQALAVTICAL